MASTVSRLARFSSAIWAFAVVACPSPALATPAFEPLDALAHAAERGLRALVADAHPEADPADIRVGIGALDPRLRLPACGTRLDVTLPPGSTLRHRTLVRVSCSTPKAWSVQLPATLEVEAGVLVLQRPLARGAEPRAADVRIVRRRLPGLSSAYLSSPDDLGPWRLRRPLDAGSPLAREALEPAPVVKRGQTVTVVSHAGGIDVRVRGEALADAAPGQRVRIRNLESLKIIDGLAVESGQVRVGP